MEGINFNMAHYMNVYKARDTSNELYCFPLRMFLGPNGLYPNHELKGKTFRRRFNGKKFVVDDVYVHWYKGWYFMALARDKNDSHVSISWNINTEDHITDFTLQDFVLWE